MSDIKAGIVALTNFVKSESKFFSGMIEYIDRDEAVRKNNVDKFSSFSEHLEYTDDIFKRIYTEQKDIEMMSSIFTKEKDNISMDDKNKLKESFKLAQKNGSLMWQSVISFDNRYLKMLGIYDDELGIIKEEKLKIASRKAINLMLEKEGLDTALWAGNIHYNTDNVHIHISTVEVFPTREEEFFYQYETEKGKYKLRYNNETKKSERIPILDENGNHLYVKERRGKFKQSSLELLKSTFISEIDITKEQNIEITNIMRDIIKRSKENDILKEKELEPKLKYLYGELKSRANTHNLFRNNWNYGRNAIADLRPVIDSITKEYIDKNFLKELKQANEVMEKRNEFYKLTYGNTDKDYMKNMLDDFKKRMGNVVLKELANHDKSISNRNFNDNKMLGMNGKDIKSKGNSFNVGYSFKKAAYKMKESLQKEKDRYLNQIDHFKLEYEIDNDFEI